MTGRLCVKRTVVFVGRRYGRGRQEPAARLGFASDEAEGAIELRSDLFGAVDELLRFLQEKMKKMAKSRQLRRLGGQAKDPV